MKGLTELLNELEIDSKILKDNKRIGDMDEETLKLELAKMMEVLEKSEKDYHELEIYLAKFIDTAKNKVPGFEEWMESDPEELIMDAA